jgi:glucose-6-phosphate dehydrogenase assembly protein OpcA
MLNPDIPLPGIQVDLPDIENALKRFWQNAAEEGHATTIRASTMNLVVINRRNDRFDEINQLIPEVSSHHPGRIIVALSSASIKSEKITASVSALCQLQDADKKQISCEQITLMTGIEGEKHLPGTLLPILLPELPVYVYLTSDDLLIDEALYPLYEMADRLIVYSSDGVDTLEEMERRIDRIVQLRNKCKISDINWSLLTPWREALAQYFDEPDRFPLLQDINNVTVLYSGGGYRMSAYLLTAWLATRLNWRLSESDPKNQIFYFNRDQTIQVKLAPVQTDLPVEGLNRVEFNLRTREKKLLAERQNRTTIFITLGGEQTEVPVPERPHSSLLCNELDFLYYDDVLMDSIKMIASMIKERQDEVAFQY